MPVVVQNQFLVQKELLCQKVRCLNVLFFCLDNVEKRFKESVNKEESGSSALLKSIYMQKEQFHEEDKRVLDAEDLEFIVI